MKHLDKIAFLVGALALGGGVAYYWQAQNQPKPKFKAPTEETIKGATFDEWKEKADLRTEPVEWSGQHFDAENGWNFDMFTAPETTWIASEKQYVPKRLQQKIVQEILGIELKSLTRPSVGYKVESCSTMTPPMARTENKKKFYVTIVKFQNENGDTGRIDFSKIPNVKLTVSEQKNGDKTRTTYALTPKTPVPVDGFENVKLKSFKIAKGEDDTGDGAIVTRYMAEFIEGNSTTTLVIIEQFYQRPDLLEAVFKEDNSSTQWRLVRKENPANPEAPNYSLYTRASGKEPWKFVSNDTKFSTSTGDHVIKMLDTDAQQATILTQPKPKNGEKPKKSRVVTLDVSA